jgi:hypothetical protein
VGWCGRAWEWRGNAIERIPQAIHVTHSLDF